MKIYTKAAQYEPIEFNHYIDHSDKGITHVVDFVIELDNIDSIEEEFANSVIATKDFAYSLSDYELIEYYEIGNGLIQVICVK